MLATCPNGSIISCIDFSKNYNSKVQNEIQSMHWHTTQVTILVHVTYRLDPSYIGNGPREILKVVHYYISYDSSPNTLFVQHCFMLHWRLLQQQGCYPMDHLVWNDGYTNRLKSSKAFYFVAHCPSLTKCKVLPNGCQLVWNFFCHLTWRRGSVWGTGSFEARGQEGVAKTKCWKIGQCVKYCQIFEEGG